MTLTCLGSGSSGNCYVLEHLGQILLLDAGVKFKKILACKALTSFSRVRGALVTHEHGDHAKSVPDLKKAGVDIFSPKSLQARMKYRVGVFDIMPFECVHDVVNYGYVIRCGGETLVYATDTAALPQIKNVDYWVVECNYNEARWVENVEKAMINFAYYGRTKTSHMGLEYLETYFDALKARSKAIVLCHLSENGNADADAMTAVMRPFADKVFVATAGLEIKLEEET